MTVTSDDFDPRDPEDPQTSGPGAEVVSPGDSEPGNGVKVSVRSDDATQSTFHIAGTHSEHNYNLFTDLGEVSNWRRDLTTEDFEVLNREQLSSILSTFVVSDADLDRVTTTLAHYRIALISGAKGLGKCGLAQIAAGETAARDQEIQQARMVTHLEPRIRVNIEKLVSNSRDLGRSIFILEDVIESGNEDLARLIDRFDRPRLQKLQRCLQDSDSYLIMTSDLERYSSRAERLADLGVLIAIERLSTEGLQTIFCRLIESRGASARQFLKPATAEAKARFFARLGTVHRAVDWLSRFLTQVAGGELELDKSLERLDNLEHWLLVDLPRNPPVWHFVLGLALASAHPRSNWVPWFQLHRFWKEVGKLMEMELDTDDDSKAKPLSSLVVNRDFLKGAEAEVRRGPEGDTVRFRDPALADRIWNVLLGSGRSILATLRPHLEEMFRSRESSIAGVAGRALGRLGELNPAEVIASELDFWLAQAQDENRLEVALLMGELLVGASSSADRLYVSGCLGRLRRAAGGAPEKADTAIVAFVPVGVATPEPVLEVLWGTVQGRFGKKAKHAGPLWRTLSESIDRSTGRRRQVAAQNRSGPTVQELESAMFTILGSRDVVILHALQFALVGICFGGDSIVSVVAALANWMRSGHALAPWIAFLVLRRRGILQILEDFPIRVVADQEVEASSSGAYSRLLVVAENDHEMVADFLEAAYSASNAIPDPLRGSMQDNLLKAVTGWLNQALEVRDARGPAKALLCRLLDSEEETLRRKIFELLRRKSVSGSEDLREFTLEILSPI